MRALKYTLASLIVVFSCMCFVGFLVFKDTRSIDGECNDKEIKYFVIDVSDKLDRGDIEYIQNEIIDIAGGANDGTNILILMPNENSYYEPIIYFSGCSIRKYKNSDSLILNKFELQEIENNRLTFENKMKSELQNLLNQPAAGKSPIFETLIYISNRYDFLHSDKNEIYLYSDLKQNTEQLSFYPKIPSDIMIRLEALERLDLKNTKVFINRTVRRSATNTEIQNKLYNFWNALVLKSNGTLKIII